MAVTCCFPGAKVLDILEQIPSLLSHPHVRNVIVHVGTNDTAKQQSELLKSDFISLFNSLKVCGRQVFISRRFLLSAKGQGASVEYLACTHGYSLNAAVTT